MILDAVGTKAEAVQPEIAGLRVGVEVSIDIC
jgi:hypothetical protein